MLKEPSVVAFDRDTNKIKAIFKAMDGIVAGLPVDFRRKNGNRILV